MMGIACVASGNLALPQSIAGWAWCLLFAVGVTAGATAKLSIPAQLLMIVYMYFGRVGVLTISLGFLTGDRARDRFRYAETNLLIG